MRTTSTLLTLLLLVAACGGGTTATKPEAASNRTTAAPVTDIQAAVEKAVKALDDLDIEHSKPKRVEAALGAKASFDLTVNGHEAKINVFPSKQQLDSWSEISDNLGGVHVAYDNAALSLNSSEGISDSAEIAPQIAEAIGGTAHGV